MPVLPLISFGAKLGLSTLAGVGVFKLSLGMMGGLTKLSSKASDGLPTSDIPFEELDIDDYQDVE